MCEETKKLSSMEPLVLPSKSTRSPITSSGMPSMSCRRCKDHQKSFFSRYFDQYSSLHNCVPVLHDQICLNPSVHSDNPHQYVELSGMICCARYVSSHNRPSTCSVFARVAECKIILALFVLTPEALDTHGKIVLDAWRDACHEFEEDNQVLVHSNGDLLLVRRVDSWGTL